MCSRTIDSLYRPALCTFTCSGIRYKRKSSASKRESSLTAVFKGNVSLSRSPSVTQPCYRSNTVFTKNIILLIVICIPLCTRSLAISPSTWLGYRSFRSTAGVTLSIIFAETPYKRPMNVSGFWFRRGGPLVYLHRYKVCPLSKSMNKEKRVSMLGAPIH